MRSIFIKRKMNFFKSLSMIIGMNKMNKYWTMKLKNTLIKGL